MVPRGCRLYIGGVKPGSMLKGGACVAAALGLLLAACGEDQAPAVQHAERALTAAREDIEKAKTSIQATEQYSKALEEKIQTQRAQLNDLVERRLTLMRQQLKDDEERIRRLPAPKETELRPRLAELGKHLQEVQAKLHAYRDAPPEKSGETLAALEQSLAALAERRRELEAQLQPA